MRILEKNDYDAVSGGEVNCYGTYRYQTMYGIKKEKKMEIVRSISSEEICMTLFCGPYQIHDTFYTYNGKKHSCPEVRSSTKDIDGEL